MKTLIILLFMTSVCYADELKLPSGMEEINIAELNDSNKDYNYVTYSYWNDRNSDNPPSFEDMQAKLNVYQARENKKLESDISESRKREELLNQEVHLLQY